MFNLSVFCLDDVDWFEPAYLEVFPPDLIADWLKTMVSRAAYQ